MFKDKVLALLNEALDERPDLFLLSCDISETNAIKVILDGDKGVLVEDCIFISRAIEHNLDREEHDFSLEVASAGATTPLSHVRQYKKNVGRTLAVKAEGEKYEGILASANEEDILLTWKAREPKPIGKGKVTVEKEVTIPYKNITEAKVKIKF
ncbi:ribosome assembly cofactor RimP [Pontimicrobium aquaticum]|uniref:Ribosome maturation factor RimP n=1 Tax=Pontimicrobium aquaticum TaxID=2565367 RepID=A0A4U0EN65_9FLAO|nr:ribosome assembly cofactor RimP [Pontimicrobium aquaticum]TJY31712.1 ribosome assembly cofactor RimP [Pontimicrobium aquaticum]